MIAPARGNGVKCSKRLKLPKLVTRDFTLSRLGTKYFFAASIVGKTRRGYPIYSSSQLRRRPLQ